MMVASLMRDMQGFQLMMNFLVMPLFFLSGALFPLTAVPEALKFIARVRPALLRHRRDALLPHQHHHLRSCHSTSPC